jgi:hypothetical protein
MDTFVILLQKADIEVAAKLYANSKQCYCFDPIIRSLAQTKGLITSLVDQGTNYDPDLWEVTALESRSEAVSIDIKASRLIGELLSIPSKYCLRWLFWEMHYYLLQRITYEYYASCLEPPQNSIVFFMINLQSII